MKKNYHDNLLKDEEEIKKDLDKDTKSRKSTERDENKETIMYVTKRDFSQHKKKEKEKNRFIDSMDRDQTENE